MAIFILEYLHSKKKVPIIPLENKSYARKKNPTDSSSTYLRTDTRRMNTKKPLSDFQSKEKELSTSSIGDESSRVTTEVGYSNKVDPRPTS